MDANSQYRTPLSRARGLGSAKDGVNRFIGERVTSIALVPLSLWAVYAVLQVAPAGYQGAVELLHSPVNAVLAILLIAVSCAHMKMGMQVIVEDYIHKPGSKAGLLLLNLFVCVLAAVVTVFCILKVALTGAAI